LIGVKNECLAFTTRHRRGKARTLIGKSYQRVRPLRHLVIKSAEEDFRAARARFASLAYFINAVENIDGESVMWAARRLAARNRPGLAPVLIVFSDGEPASTPESIPILCRHLKSTIKRVSAAGIHVIGVGIGTDCVEHYYPQHVVVNKVDDLVKVTYGLIRSVGQATSR